ncbi:MAG TPA: hypothetical protein VHS58_16070, partial [Acetobacteraceae bacterium]|nr:hypothetical protein [Acetobacteraceae bacterium]
APEVRRALEQQLRDSDAASDVELVAAANALLGRVASRDPKLAVALGVDLEGITAGRVRIADIISAGSGVRVKNTVAAGDFEVSGVRAGNVGEYLGKL